MRSSRQTDARRRVGRRSGLALALAMAAVNVLGYGSVLLVSGALGPADFGAVAALTGLGVVCVVPGGAMQVLVAARRGGGRPLPMAERRGLVVGATVAATLALVSPLAQHALSLPSIWPVLWLAAAVIPTTVGSVQQGLLLGSERVGALTAVVVASGASRLGASGALVWGGAGVSGVMAGWAAAALVPVALGLVLTRRDRGIGRGPAQGTTPPVERPRQWMVDVLRSSVTFGALITMTNVDVVLARHFLTAHDSGLYGVASMFARVVFWTTQFIPMLVVPRLSGRRSRAVVLRAYLAVVVVASPALVVLAVVPGSVLRLLGLHGYGAASDELPLFGLLGVLWACIQVSTFAGIARGRGRITASLWCGVAVQVLTTVLVWDDSVAEILLAAALGAVVALGGIWAPVRGRGVRRDVTSPSATSSARDA
jgi:O-antigen/teichoic acid export membrane protein